MMKKQIKRVSPHQNAKVFAILMAVSSLFFVVPMLAGTYFAAPPVDQQNNSMFQKYFFTAFPLLYLIFGYLTTLIGCTIYNYMFKFIGGFEYEVNDHNTPTSANDGGQLESRASAFKIS
jgi:hypothetical protein